MSKPYHQLSDTDLVTWANNAATKLGAAPAAYNITADQTEAFSDLASAFAEAAGVWNDPATRRPIASTN